MLKPEPVYDIPIHLLGAFRGRRVILRSSDPAEVISTVKESEIPDVVGIRLTELTSDSAILHKWGEGVPVELSLSRPNTEFQYLYRHVKLLDHHPVRLRVLLANGAARALKLAASLRFPVKIDVNQPDAEAITELQAILDFYLHNSGVAEPVEFFHSVLVAMLSDQETTLWEILEENPAFVRYVNDEGIEMMIRSKVGCALVTTGLEYFIEEFVAELFRENAECCSCEFFKCCGGYFKWPLKKFRCSETKQVFETLKLAALDLRADLAEYRLATAEVTQ